MAVFDVEWKEEDGPLNSRDLRHGFGAFATGVTIVTARSEDGVPVGCTANSFSSVSVDPPLLLWNIAESAQSYQAYREARHFGVNILARDQMELAMRFATPEVDKFADGTWTDGLAGVPILDGALAHFECSTEAIYPGGDHAIVLGRIHRFRWSDGQPLLFYRGKFPQLATED
ncbi:MAG: flavin reductase family protein [Alphaproteobacteria bacterium]